MKNRIKKIFVFALLITGSLSFCFSAIKYNEGSKAIDKLEKKGGVADN